MYIILGLTNWLILIRSRWNFIRLVLSELRACHWCRRSRANLRERIFQNLSLFTHKKWLPNSFPSWGRCEREIAPKLNYTYASYAITSWVSNTHFSQTVIRIYPMQFLASSSISLHFNILRQARATIDNSTALIDLKIKFFPVFSSSNQYHNLHMLTEQTVSNNETRTQFDVLGTQSLL